MLSKYKYHFVVLLAGLSYSTYAIFAKLLSIDHVDIFNQIFWRSVFASLSGLILARVVGKINFSQIVKLEPKFGKYILVNTLLYLGSSTSFIGSIYFGTPVAKATILSYAYPLLLFSPLGFS